MEKDTITNASNKDLIYNWTKRVQKARSAGYEIDDDKVDYIEALLLYIYYAEKCFYEIPNPKQQSMKEQENLLQKNDDHSFGKMRKRNVTAKATLTQKDKEKNKAKKTSGKIVWMRLLLLSSNK